MLWKRTRRKRRAEARARLVVDVRSVAGYAEALVAEAERLDLPVPPVVLLAVVALRAWAWQLTEEPSGR
jgi:hypothetical protein